ncbi:hypothetical protein OH77DRAFT_1072043 [Trametes cingulata]|nr:hypothetical protein OH77DRAFT_1072043 [Trametes cingulata]
MVTTSGAPRYQLFFHASRQTFLGLRAPNPRIPAIALPHPFQRPLTVHMSNLAHINIPTYCTFPRFSLPFPLALPRQNSECAPSATSSDGGVDFLAPDMAGGRGEDGVREIGGRQEALRGGKEVVGVARLCCLGREGYTVGGLGGEEMRRVR